MVMAEQENGAKRGRKDAERREMRKRGERGGKQLRAEQSRAEETGLACACFCVWHSYIMLIKDFLSDMKSKLLTVGV